MILTAPECVALNILLKYKFKLGPDLSGHSASRLRHETPHRTNAQAGRHKRMLQRRVKHFAANIESAVYVYTIGLLAASTVRDEICKQLSNLLHY